MSETIEYKNNKTLNNKIIYLFLIQNNKNETTIRLIFNRIKEVGP